MSLDPADLALAPTILATLTALTWAGWHTIRNRRKGHSMAEPVANDGNWTTEPDERCPGCNSTGNRRVSIDLDCPRYMQNGRLMACIGCGNAVRFECRTPDEDGDLLEDGCGWWFQYPLHPQASGRASMGEAPPWDFARYQS